MKNSVLFASVILMHLGVFGQQADSLSLEDCIRAAGQRSPLNSQKTLSGEALSFKLKNLGTRWLPAIGFNAQASYNSETVDFSDIMKNLPVSIPSLPLEQYKVWADLNQQLYDGGMVRAQKSIEKASYEADLQQTETELRVVKQQVNQAYFTMLITRKSAEVLQVSLNELRERKKVVRAGVDQGAVLPENMFSMDAEELKLQQGLVELNLAQQQMLKVLSILMDTVIAENAVLTLPAEPENQDQQILRPEYLLFDKQKERLAASQKMVTATDMPRFFAYSQGAYGRPGYNMVSRSFHPYYSVGVGMKWNFLNYGDSRRQKKLFEIQKDMVDIKKKTFDDQLNIQLEAEKVNQAKYAELLKQDEQILNLRKAIAASGFAKLTNGVITSTDYFSELNSEILARLQYENHKILKLQAAYNYLLLQGKL
jgi:outer membrane protein TolC